MVDVAPRVSDFAERFGVPACYSTVEELLEDKDIAVPDIISAVVPVGQNAAVVAACAEAGVRVVSCEKPIHFSLEEADRLIALCKQKGTLFGCAQCHFSQPQLTEVFDWVTAGNIGEITAASIPSGFQNEISGGACPQLVSAGRLRSDTAVFCCAFSPPPLLKTPRPDRRQQSGC